MESTLLCIQMVGRGKEEEEEDREGMGRKRGGRSLPNYVQCVALFPQAWEVWMKTIVRRKKGREKKSVYTSMVYERDG